MLTKEARNNALCELIGHAHEGLAKAAHIREADYRRSQQIEAAIPDVLNSLVENRRIAPGDTLKTAAALRDPVSALQLLKLVAAHDNRPGTTTFGQTYKTAGRMVSTREQRIRQAEEELYQNFDL